MDDYIVFLQERDKNDGNMENDHINFHQAMQSAKPVKNSIFLKMEKR